MGGYAALWAYLTKEENTHMGMFDKDKEIGLIMQRAFPQGEHFIVFSAEITREDFPTNLGPAVQATLEVATLKEPRSRFEVTTLASAITAKIREAEDDDFPARVFWTLAPSRFGQDATVLQFVGPFDARASGGQVTRHIDPLAAGDPGPMAEPLDGRDG